MSAEQLKFEALVNAYSADLYRYAYWLCKQTALAEDMVQETFMRAWKALDSLQEPAAAKSWLFTILRREVARHFGREKMETVSMQDDRQWERLATDSTPHQVEAWVLRRALGEVPQDYLEPLLLQVIGGYSCDEIADIIGIKSGAVMTRVCRARQKLRSVLLEDADKTRSQV